MRPSWSIGVGVSTAVIFDRSPAVVPSESRLSSPEPPEVELQVEWHFGGSSSLIFGVTGGYSDQDAISPVGSSSGIVAQSVGALLGFRHDVLSPESPVRLSFFGTVSGARLEQGPRSDSERSPTALFLTQVAMSGNLAAGLSAEYVFHEHLGFRLNAPLAEVTYRSVTITADGQPVQPGFGTRPNGLWVGLAPSPSLEVRVYF